MAWGKLDDKFHRNRKVRALRKLKGGKEALGVWILWWSWCLDDPSMSGVVPYEELERDRDLKSAQMLVDAGLWDRVGEDFSFHDFHVYNMTPEQREAQRKAHAASQAKYRSGQKQIGGDARVINHAPDEVMNHHSEREKNQPSRVHTRAGDGTGLGSGFSETDRVEQSAGERLNPPEPWQVHDAINAARVAAGLSGVLALSHPEQTALAGYCRLHAMKPDVIAYAVASHMAWVATPDAVGKYGTQSPIGAWLRKPDDAIMAKTKKAAPPSLPKPNTSAFLPDVPDADRAFFRANTERRAQEKADAIAKERADAALVLEMTKAAAAKEGLAP